MSYDALKVKPSRNYIHVLQIDYDGCGLQFGVGACQATGEPCRLTLETCTYTQAYVAVPKQLKLCSDNVATVPEGYYPLIKGAPQSTSVEIKPNQSIGIRPTVSFDIVDVMDSGLDPYTRADKASWVANLYKMKPFLHGLKLTWYAGFDHAPLNLNSLKKRIYYIDTYAIKSDAMTITARDSLKMADGNKSKYPEPSTGLLKTKIEKNKKVTIAGNELEVPNNNTLIIELVTNRPNEYDFLTIGNQAGQFGAVSIGSEIFYYNSIDKSTHATDKTIKLGGIIRSKFNGYVTEYADHEAGAAVQRCAWFIEARTIDVLRELLVNGLKLDAALIPFSDWEREYDDWTNAIVLNRLITKPADNVKSLIDALIMQSQTFGLWVDDVTNTIKWASVRTVEYGEPVAYIDEAANEINNSLTIDIDHNDIYNTIIYEYNATNPTKNDSANYANAFMHIEQTLIDQIKQNRTLKIAGDWHKTAGDTIIRIICKMIIALKGKPRRTLKFSLDAKDDNIKVGDFIDFNTTRFAETIRARVVKVDYGVTAKIVAVEEFARAYRNVPRIAPNHVAEYTTASALQRGKYAFICNDNGKMPNGDEGYQIYLG